MISKPFEAGKRLLRTIAASPYVVGMMSPLQGRLSILNYHRVMAHGSSIDRYALNSSLSVSSDLFTRHMRFLRQRMRCVSLAQAIDALETGQDITKMVVVTFDDGYRDNLSVALPIAEAFSIPIAIFVTTGFIDQTANLWWEELPFIFGKLNRITFDHPETGIMIELSLGDERRRHEALISLSALFKRSSLIVQNRLLGQLREQAGVRYTYDSEVLNWDELRLAKKNPLVTIGGHTCNHPILARETLVTVEQELRESQDRFECELGEPAQFCAYPNGQKEHAADREFLAAKGVGYRAALTSEPTQVRQDRHYSLFSLPRMPVDQSDSLSTFAWRLSGF